MHNVGYAAIVDAVSRICISAACDLPDHVVASLEHASKTESSSEGRELLFQCLRNAEIATSRKIPICQDTGVAIFFVEIGQDVCITGGLLTDAINEGCSVGYQRGYLRKSIVSDPLFDRINTGTNTPAIIHIEMVAGNRLDISLILKGGGCENISALRMFKPTEDKQAIIQFVADTIIAAGGNPCPPVIVGVGIGGSADKAGFLAKRALLRETGIPNTESRYALLEREILNAVNRSGNGPQGLGGTVTALAVHIETFPCHIASLPVAVNCNCHAARQAHIVL